MAASVRVAAVLLVGVLCWGALVSCEEEQNATDSTTTTTTTTTGDSTTPVAASSTASSSELNEPDFKTPEYIISCRRNDPKLDTCFQNQILHMRPYLVKGIPELEMPPIEPLVIPEMKIENGQGPVRIRAFFTNITAIGPGNYSITKARVNLPAYRFDIHLAFPKIELQGSYDINGNVLLFPIQSHGDFWALFGDVSAVVRIQTVEHVRDGVRYMTISKMLIDFKLGRIRFRIMDQLNGNNVIGQAMNQFLNQNAHEIVDELRPAASVSIAKHFKEFLNTAFNRLPLKIWLRDT